MSFDNSSYLTVCLALLVSILVVEHVSSNMFPMMLKVLYTTGPWKQESMALTKCEWSRQAVIHAVCSDLHIIVINILILDQIGCQCW